MEILREIMREKLGVATINGSTTVGRERWSILYSIVLWNSFYLLTDSFFFKNGGFP